MKEQPWKTDPRRCKAMARHNYTTTDLPPEVDCDLCNRMADGRFCPRHEFLATQGITSRRAVNDPAHRDPSRRRA